MFEVSVALGDRFVNREYITADVAVIGRDPASDVVLPNPGVSRRHAEIRSEEGRFLIRDLDSKNGLTVNGTPVASAQLGPGDVVGIGKYSLVVRAAGVDALMAANEETFISKDRSASSRRLYFDSETGDVYHCATCEPKKERSDERTGAAASGEGAEVMERVSCPDCT